MTKSEMLCRKRLYAYSRVRPMPNVIKDMRDETGTAYGQYEEVLCKKRRVGYRSWPA